MGKTGREALSLNSMCLHAYMCLIAVGCHLKCHKEHADIKDMAMQPCVGGVCVCTHVYVCVHMCVCVERT